MTGNLFRMMLFALRKTRMKIKEGVKTLQAFFVYLHF